MRILAILTVRNEGAFLLEWLAHHRAARITDFLIYSNDCQDGTDAMLDRLDQMGLVMHRRNDGPYDKGGIQFTALKDAGKSKEIKQADWILPMDVDEFVNVHVGDHTLPALIAALPEATAITLTWRLFGNGGQIRFEDRPILETFTRAAPEVMYWPWRSAMFKTLYRNDGIYGMPGVHRPRRIDEARLDQARWFNGNGEELEEQFKTRRIFSNYGRDNYKMAQMNHYALGAMESYVLKADRGRAVHSDHMLDIDYWVERNFNQAEDTSIASLGKERAALLAEMKTDPELHALHKQAVKWRKTRFDDLMEQEPFRALFGRLMMTPPSNLVSQNGARFMIQYANRARSRGT